MRFIKVKTIYDQVAIINLATITLIREELESQGNVEIWTTDRGHITTKIPISEFSELLIIDSQFDLSINDD